MPNPNGITCVKTTRQLGGRPKQVACGSEADYIVSGALVCADHLVIGILDALDESEIATVSYAKE